ncbi:MAG TPA: cytochrome c [Xanthobacteraceae bacterium]
MAWLSLMIRRVLWMHSLVLAVLIVAFAAARARAEEAAADKGERLYAKYCATCHGDDLQNNSGVAFDLRRLTADEHPRFVNSVQHGKNAMPSWQGVLTSDQIDDLWAYIGEHRYEK